MRDRPQILAGLLVFVGLFTFPLWHGRIVKASPTAPDIKLPAKEKQCVAPLSYMRNSHMQLLVNWRDRSGARQPAAVYRLQRQGVRKKPHAHLPHAVPHEQSGVL